MMFIAELFVVISTVLVVWSISGVLLETAHELCFDTFGNHFF